MAEAATRNFTINIAIDFTSHIPSHVTNLSIIISFIS